MGTRARGRVALAAALAAVACTSAADQPRPATTSTPVATTVTPTPPTTTAPTPTPLAPTAASAALGWADALRAADWARWPGLPATLRERELLDALAIDPSRVTRGDARLGRRDVVVVDTGGLRYWLRDGDHVILVEVTGNLGTAAPAALQRQLGAPAREGAGRLLLAGATTTELVYPARGIAVTVAASYDNPPSFAPRLAAVQLFATTELRTFVLELGGDDRGGPVH